jgi:hypothetical protein
LVPIGVSEVTIYTWKSKYGGMDVSDAQKLKSLEDENRRLKHLVADLSLDKGSVKRGDPNRLASADQTAATEISPRKHTHGSPTSRTWARPPVKWNYRQLL